MTHTKLLLLICLVFVMACTSKSPSNTTPSNSTSTPVIKLSPQDSLRNILVQRIQPSVLQSSVIEELLIRRLVEVRHDSLVFQLPFDLHSFDAGAPDCYYNELAFSFPLGEELVFPPSLPYREKEYGCVPETQVFSGRFQLVDLSQNYLHYADEDKSLIIYSQGSTDHYLYYFIGADQTRLGPNDLLDYLEQLVPDEDEPPMRSTRMYSSDYREFL